MSKERLSFDQRCYSLLVKVPRGKVTTYKAIGKALGTKAYRAIGQAMKRNPHAPKVPCHRVIRSDGSLGGYAGGLTKKISLLQREGISTRRGMVENFKSKLFEF